MPVEVAVEASHPALAPAVAVVFDQEQEQGLLLHWRSLCVQPRVSSNYCHLLHWFRLQRQKPRATLAGVLLVAVSYSRPAPAAAAAAVAVVFDQHIHPLVAVVAVEAVVPAVLAVEAVVAAFV